jgi:hypothetical protein
MIVGDDASDAIASTIDRRDSSCWILDFRTPFVFLVLQRHTESVSVIFLQNSLVPSCNSIRVRHSQSNGRSGM